VSVAIPSDSEIILRVQPVPLSGSLTGAVTDSTRRPVTGAAVSLMEARGNRALSITRTDALGMYRFPRMSAGYYAVRCAAEGYAQPRTGMATIEANKEARIDFRLEAGNQIRGIVVNQKAEPVIQAQVIYSVEDAQRGRFSVPQGMDRTAGRIYLADELQRATTSGVTTTDSEGRFQISGVPDAQYRLSVSHRDYISTVMRVKPSSQTQTVTLDSGLSVRGTVSDVRGAAVERFTVTFQSTTSRSERSYPFTTTDGHFEIHGLARDVYQVVLQASGRERYSGTLDLQGSIEVFVALDPGNGGRGAKPLNLQRVK